MANVLAQSKKQMVIRLLVEGNSIRGTERITGVHRDTICRLLMKVGEKVPRFSRREDARPEAESPSA
jgi:transposase-like protein